MMKQAVLNTKIKEKFGSLSRFCRLCGEDRYEVQKILVRKHSTVADLNRIEQLYKNTKVDGYDKTAISSELVSKMKQAIKQRGGVRKFCREHTYYDTHSGTIYALLKGKRKIITPFIRTLCETLKIKL